MQFHKLLTLYILALSDVFAVPIEGKIEAIAQVTVAGTGLDQDVKLAKRAGGVDGTLTNPYYG